MPYTLVVLPLVIVLALEFVLLLTPRRHLGAWLIVADIVVVACLVVASIALYRNAPDLDAGWPRGLLITLFSVLAGTIIVLTAVLSAAGVFYTWRRERRA